MFYRQFLNYFVKNISNNELFYENLLNLFRNGNMSLEPDDTPCG